MVKVFRKNREDALAKNRLVKYLFYALGEIVLVVIGILIALKVNNWNEVQKYKAKEQALLLEINREANENLQQFEANKLVHQRSLNACNIVLRNARTLDKQASLDSIAQYGPGAFLGLTFNPSGGVVKSLISTGEIQLITSDSLRFLLITWQDELLDFQEEEQYSRDLWQNHVEPYIIKNGDFLNAGSPKNLAMCQDPQFLNMLARRQFYLHGVLLSEESATLEQTLRDIVRLSTPQ